LRTTVLLAVLIALAWLLHPWLRQAVRIAKLLREAPPSPQSPLPVPVEGVERSALVDTWGGARSEGRKHEGIDIFAPRGTQILAATHGVVLFRGWNRLGGKTFTILGPGGYRHYYAHLDEYDTPGNGDWVERGEVLGYVGTTGNAAGTPPHLHYGIYTPLPQPPESGAINPYPLLTGATGTQNPLGAPASRRPTYPASSSKFSRRHGRP
jgi:murein DD-endopeptidase MepM/ murein hydrolase activator NlpD